MTYLVKKSQNHLTTTKAGEKIRTDLDSFEFWKILDVGDMTMFVEEKVRYSALFTSLVGWHAGAVSFPLSDVILAHLACPLSDVMFCLHSGITNLSLYKHWSALKEKQIISL